MMKLIQTGFFKHPYPNPKPITPQLCAAKTDQNHRGASDVKHQSLILNFFVIPET